MVFMDIAVKTEYLKKIVSCASRITSNKAIQPILNNILFVCDNGSLKIAATDLDLSIECRLPAEVSNPGQVTIPAKKLDEIVSKVVGEEISFKTDKNFLTNIKCNKSKFQINGVSSDEFPDITGVQEKEKYIQINQDELIRAVSLTSFAASKFDTTSVLSGVNFEIGVDGGNKFEIGATDGSRLARYIGNLSIKGKIDKASVVVPFRAMAELERLMSSFKDGNETIGVYLKKGQIVFKNNDFLLSSRLVDNKFPAYDKLIPKDQSSKAVVDRNELLSSLERVAILSNERTSVVKLEFKKGEDTLRISANSPDYGNAVDEVGIEYSGKDIEIAFNYRYMTEALRNLDTEKVSIELEGPLSPLLLKLDNEDLDYYYTYLIMPVQIR